MKGKRFAEDDFYHLYSLIEENTWLCGKSDGLIELFGLCYNVSQKDLVTHLVNNFQQINGAELETVGKKIAGHLINNWRCDKTTKIIAISDRNVADGSQAFLQMLKDKFVRYGWENGNFINSFGEGALSVEDGNMAILFDDFIGSGKTIKSKYESFKKTMKTYEKDVNVRVLSYAIMENVYFELIAEGIPVYSPIKLKKGISDHFSQEISKELKNEMIRIESCLQNPSKRLNLNDFSLGFKQSETIFKFENYNIPDNVFPIFWWPEKKKNIKRSTLFNRMN